MKDYLKCLLQLILSPRNGWEDIEKGDVSPSRLAVDGFLPLIAITAVSVFVRAMFLHHVEFLTLFIDMIITFVVYFISYFFGTFILSIFMEPMVDGEYDEQKCQTFTLYTLGLLALITIIFNCFPLPKIMLFFFALYIERFLSVKSILQSYARLFCKVGFSPDKFRLFFLWQIIE